PCSLGEFNSICPDLLSSDALLSEASSAFSATAEEASCSLAGTSVIAAAGAGGSLVVLVIFSSFEPASGSVFSSALSVFDFLLGISSVSPAGISAEIRVSCAIATLLSGTINSLAASVSSAAAFFPDLLTFSLAF